MFKIKINDKQGKGKKENDENKDDAENDVIETKVEKIEICYFCRKKFDMNKDELSYYKYGKFPMCGYCAEFYGFYSD